MAFCDIITELFNRNLDHVIGSIFVYVDLHTIKSASRVSLSWQRNICVPGFWHHLMRHQTYDLFYRHCLELSFEFQEVASLSWWDFAKAYFNASQARKRMTSFWFGDQILSSLKLTKHASAIHYVSSKGLIAVGFNDGLIQCFDCSKQSKLVFSLNAISVLTESYIVRDILSSKAVLMSMVGRHLLYFWDLNDGHMLLHYRNDQLYLARIFNNFVGIALFRNHINEDFKLNLYSLGDSLDLFMSLSFQSCLQDVKFNSQSCFVLTENSVDVINMQSKLRVFSTKDQCTDILVNEDLLLMSGQNFLHVYELKSFDLIRTVKQIPPAKFHSCFKELMIVSSKNFLHLIDLNKFKGILRSKQMKNPHLLAASIAKVDVSKLYSPRRLHSKEDFCLDGVLIMVCGGKPVLFFKALLT